MSNQLMRSTGRLAIRNFATWLLADTQIISTILGVELPPLENLENLDNTKYILENAITKSTYWSEDSSNQHRLKIRWNLGQQIDLAIITTCCLLSRWISYFFTIFAVSDKSCYTDFSYKEDGDLGDTCRVECYRI